MKTKSISNHLPLRLLLLLCAFSMVGILSNPLYGETTSQATFYVR